ncbi:MAG: hypothetical protein FJ039_10550 [Chloroflexi bacterium]|nr:hypothetical protein [Chloroflexota bacterium]
MRRFSLLAIALLATLTLAACSTGDEKPPTTTPRPTASPVPGSGYTQVAVNAPFTLKVGGYAELAGAQVLIAFNEVVNDSRCPVDVTCIRAGEATVVLSISSSNPAIKAPVVLLKLVVGGEHPAAAAGSAYGYSFTALELKPAPRSTQPIAQGDYVATLAAKAN